MNIVTVGGATQDIFIYYDDIQSVNFYNKHEEKSFIVLQEGAKIEINRLHYSTGGGATNSAVSLQRLGNHVTIISMISDDQAGHQIQQALQQENINISTLQVTQQERTGVSYIIPCANGERTILAYRGANGFLTWDAINKEIIKQADQLYITSLSGASSQLLLPLTEYAKKMGVHVANNPGISQLSAGAHTLQEALTYIDIFIINSSEAQQFMLSLAQTNDLENLNNQENPNDQQKPKLLNNLITIEEKTFNIIQFFKEILKRGPTIAVVTNGAEGVYVAHENTLYFHESLPTNVISTLGAGDAFGSCFVTLIQQQNSIPEAMIKGILNSQSVIQYADAKQGLLTMQELNKRFAEIGTQGIQRYFFK